MSSARGPFGTEILIICFKNRFVPVPIYKKVHFHLKEKQCSDEFDARRRLLRLGVNFQIIINLKQPCKKSGTNHPTMSYGEP
jgi:hypothetical protein